MDRDYDELVDDAYKAVVMAERASDSARAHANGINEALWIVLAALPEFRSEKAHQSVVDLIEAKLAAEERQVARRFARQTEASNAFEAACNERTAALKARYPRSSTAAVGN